MNPPFKGKLVKAMLANYYRCKQAAPFNTSCCLLLPAFMSRNIHPYLKHWKKIHTFPKFTTVVQVPFPNGTYRYLRPGLPFDMIVLYDPPKPQVAYFGSTTQTNRTQLLERDNVHIITRRQSTTDDLKLVAFGRLAHSVGGYSQGPEVLVGFDTMASRNFISKSGCF